MPFEISRLDYDYNALEPYIDAQTMEIHYTKHHQGYTDKLNTAIQKMVDDPKIETDIDTKTIEQILENISSEVAIIRNNAGGFYNHNLFWNVMSPDGGGEPTGELASAIEKSFKGFEQFKTIFSEAAKTRFGSGWAWLVKKSDGTLAVTSTPNQDNPLMDAVPADEQGTPILCLDVWEHAYYLKYQNKRPDYIENWWNIVDWEEVSKKYE
ncbi:MAG: superoxide dismutase [Candidatus Nomurabacteria bacterium]|nr:superoxide dismutase [Candidatus Nomurabacteria bacterium]